MLGNVLGKPLKTILKSIKQKSGTPCVSKRFRYMRKKSKKIVVSLMDTLKPYFIACEDSYPDGHKGRIPVENPHHRHSHH